MTGTYRIPRLILRHSGADSNATFEIVTIADTHQMRDYRVHSVGKIVEVTGPDSLVEVPNNTLLAIFNSTRGEKPLDRFRDRQTAERRTFEVLPQLATPYTIKIEERQMSEAATKETKAKAAKKSKEKKAAEAGETPAAEAAPKTPGVIATVKELISRPEGATIEEIVAECKVRFPDRTEDGMRSTAKIQSSRLAKSTGVEINTYLVKDRGRVYRFANVEIPAELVIETPAEPTPKATKAQKKNQEAAVESATA